MAHVNMLPHKHTSCRMQACMALSGLALVVLVSPALAQNNQPTAPESAIERANPPVQGQRYSFAPVEGGALRLDTLTGAVSLCSSDAQGYACKLVPDSRIAYEAQIVRLKQDLAALQQQLDLTAPDAAPQGNNAPQAIPETPPTTGSPSTSQQSMDAAFDYADKVLRWLRNVMKDAPPPPGEESL